MKLKTTLLALVTVLVLCGSFAFAAVANADLELTLDSASCSPGETVTLTLNMEQNPGFSYLGLYLDYDTEALTLSSVKNVAAITHMTGLRQQWYTSDGSNFSGSGTLATLTFVVNEGAADGDYTIGIMTAYAECYNEAEDDVAISFTNGTIKVCSHANTTVTTIDPTCTESGESIVNCASCGVELGRKDIAPLGHTEGDWIVDVEPLCTEEGSKHQICSVCGDTIAYDVIPAKGHGETCAVEVETPTCTEDGEIWNVCLDCDAVLSTEAIPALGHTTETWKTQKAPTCTEEGLDVLLCTVCDATVDTKVLPVIPHSYNDGEVTTEPTCAKEGVLTYSCVDCGHSYTESIAKVAHVYDALGICTVCGAESALYISAADTKCALGETFAIDLNIERNAGVFYLSIYLEYDTDALELVSVDNGKIFNLTSGIMYVWTATVDDITETGTLATFNFAVKDTASAETTYPISFKLYECYNGNEEEVDAIIGSASVYVFDYIYGDANGDGKVNGRDSTLLLKYLANYNPLTGESSVVLGPSK